MSFSIEFRVRGQRQVVDVSALDRPAGGIGLPGSVLDIAMGSDIETAHACGGVCACSTCHIIVREGLDSCNPSSEDEDDQLDKAPGLTPQSRLACQTVPNGTK